MAPARLFSALLLPEEAAGSLRGELARLGGGAGAGLRWIPPDSWHVTLGFYGDRDDVGAQADWLRQRVVGCPAPTVRLAGAGTFPGVLWVGVRGDGLAELATAAGAGRDGRDFSPHLTIARGRSTPRDWVPRLAGYLGDPWQVAEVALMRSDPGGRAPRYTVVESCQLTTDRAG